MEQIIERVHGMDAWLRSHISVTVLLYCGIGMLLVVLFPKFVHYVVRCVMRVKDSAAKLYYDVRFRRSGIDKYLHDWLESHYRVSLYAHVMFYVLCSIAITLVCGYFLEPQRELVRSFIVFVLLYVWYVIEGRYCEPWREVVAEGEVCQKEVPDNICKLAIWGTYILLWVLFLFVMAHCLKMAYGVCYVLPQFVLLWSFARYLRKLEKEYGGGRFLNVEVGRGKYYSAFHSAIRRYANEQTNEATVIALTAGWGHGKTHLLNYVASRAKLPYRKLLHDDSPEENLYRGRFAVCKVSLWQYGNIESAWIGVASALTSSLSGRRMPRYVYEEGLMYKMLLFTLSIFSKIDISLMRDLLDFVRSETGSDEKATRIAEWMRRNYRDKKVLLILDDVERANAEIIGGMLSLVERLKKLDFMVVICSFSQAEMERKCVASNVVHTSFQSFIEKVFNRIEVMPAATHAALDAYYDLYADNRYGKECKAILIKDLMKLKFDYPRQAERVADLCESLYKEHFQPRYPSDQTDMDDETAYFLSTVTGVEILRIYDKSRLEADWRYVSSGTTESPEKDKIVMDDARCATQAESLIDSVVICKLYTNNDYFERAYTKEYTRRNSLSVCDCIYALSKVDENTKNVIHALQVAFGGRIADARIDGAARDLISYAFEQAGKIPACASTLWYLLRGEVQRKNDYINPERLTISLLALTSRAKLNDEVIKLTKKTIDCLALSEMMRICNGIYCDKGRSCLLAYSALPIPESGACLHSEIRSYLELQYILKMCNKLANELNKEDVSRFLREKGVRRFLECQFDYENLQEGWFDTMQAKLPGSAMLNLLENVLYVWEVSNKYYGGQEHSSNRVKFVREILKNHKAFEKAIEECVASGNCGPKRLEDLKYTIRRVDAMRETDETLRSYLTHLLDKSDIKNPSSNNENRR